MCVSLGVTVIAVQCQLHSPREVITWVPNSDAQRKMFYRHDPTPAGQLLFNLPMTKKKYRICKNVSQDTTLDKFFLHLQQCTVLQKTILKVFSFISTEMSCKVANYQRTNLKFVVRLSALGRGRQKMWQVKETASLINIARKQKQRLQDAAPAQ